MSPQQPTLFLWPVTSTGVVLAWGRIWILYGLVVVRILASHWTLRLPPRILEVQWGLLLDKWCSINVTIIILLYSTTFIESAVLSSIITYLIADRILIPGCASVSPDSTLLYSALYAILRLQPERTRVTQRRKSCERRNKSRSESEWETVRTAMFDDRETLKPGLPWASQECEPIHFLDQPVLTEFLSLENKSLEQCFRFCPFWLNGTNLCSLPSYWEVPCSAK